MNFRCFLSLLLLTALYKTDSFQVMRHTRVVTTLHAENEYRNAPTKVLSNFMSKNTTSTTNTIDFDCPKIPKVPLEILAQALDADLYETEWFVTGNVNARYFSDAFRFQDPDVKITGLQEYAMGVNKIFDQDTARAEIIATIVHPKKANTILCTWRLSGKVNILNGLTIKPYEIVTDFTIDAESGLIVLQEDHFQIPQWDILVSALFPMLIGRLTSPPAPKPSPRNPPPQMPRLLAK